MTPEEFSGSPDQRVNVPIPIPSIGNLLPSANGKSLEIVPPPAIEGMPPLSATAMSSFASAAKGVTTKQEIGASDNKEGLIVLNGTA